MSSDAQGAFRLAVVSLLVGVAALVVSGISFYYQFVREVHDLRATVLPLSSYGAVIRIPVILRNEGNRAEVIQSVAPAFCERRPCRVVDSKMVKGPLALKPGETLNVEFTLPNRCGQRVGETAHVLRSGSLTHVDILFVPLAAKARPRLRSVEVGWFRCDSGDSTSMFTEIQLR